MYDQATQQDIEIIYDVCWMLSPSQIQRMCTNYFVADYEVKLFFARLNSISENNLRTLSRLKFYGLLPQG